MSLKHIDWKLFADTIDRELASAKAESKGTSSAVLLSVAQTRAIAIVIDAALDRLDRKYAPVLEKGICWKGVHQRGQDYFKGDVVSKRGIWIATIPTSQTPGDGSDWQLAVKAG